MPITIERRCPFTGKLNFMQINISEENYQKGLKERAQGKLIQHAFPQLSPDEREFILTGITPEEWDNTFKDE